MADAKPQGQACVQGSKDEVARRQRDMAQQCHLEISSQVAVHVARNDGLCNAILASDELIAELTCACKLLANAVPDDRIEDKGLIRSTLDGIKGRQIDDVVLIRALLRADEVHDDVARRRRRARLRQPCKYEDVRILTAEENVCAGPTSDRVVARASGDVVVPRASDQNIGPAAAGHFKSVALPVEIDRNARRSVCGRHNFDIHKLRI